MILEERVSLAYDGAMYQLMFICTGNSCRSQMAEGFAEHYGGGKVKAYSAGIRSSQVNPLAIKAMAEKGIDITHHTSKTIDLELLKQMDQVVTVCGHADETCPMVPPGVKKEHWPFDDPPKLAEGLSEDKALPIYRRVRDEIEVAITSFLKRQGFQNGN